jgi:MCP family monocarboxylic acid transporter-like MFS transporter 10
MNVTTPALFLASILAFLWSHLRGTGALVTLAPPYGASLGGLVTFPSAPMIALGDSTDAGRRTGMPDSPSARSRPYLVLSITRRAVTP